MPCGPAKTLPQPISYAFPSEKARRRTPQQPPSGLNRKLEGTDPNTIVQGKTDIIPGRPTQDHHNNPEVRLLKHYEKKAENYLGMLQLACGLLWFRRLHRLTAT